MAIKEYKIIWAVDPKAEVGLKNVALKAISALTRKKLATIEPVYFLSTSLDSTPTQTAGDTFSLARRALSDQFNALVGVQTLAGLQPLTILTGTDLSKKRMTIELSRYAQMQKADVIVLATHGRKGIKRWMLGSFAETLMRESSIPLFIINPHWKLSGSLKNILFPTDFSEASHDAFLKVVDFAGTSGSDITLFHKLNLVISSEQPAASPFPKVDTRDFQPVLDEQILDRRIHALKWASEAQAQARVRGLKVIVSIDDHWSQPVADSILKEQTKTGGVIALVSHFGETSRNIALNNSSAVWILYPEEKVQRNSVIQSAA
jgi:nucleotide-binding universal stress UspA family protein